MGFVLFIIAYILFLPLSFLNYFFVKNKNGYFFQSALNLDIYANKEFKTIFNEFLILENGYKFGKDGETISSVLGKNKLGDTLSTTGKKLANFLDFLDKNHCINSIIN